MITGFMLGLAFAHAEEAEADPGLFFEYLAIAGLITAAIWAARALWRRRRRPEIPPFETDEADADRVQRQWRE